ncbi:MAG TPA: hypothetical protein DD435_01855 [Cyanobacteria bacterium UBA8530]|nr:hypothetical protein [Cyanobacteria bacterium UBA8530]
MKGFFLVAAIASIGCRGPSLAPTLLFSNQAKALIEPVSSCAVVLDPVFFSGNLKVLVKNPPRWAKSYLISLLDLDSGSNRFSTSFAATKVMSLHNLRTGIRYQVLLEAKGGNRSLSARSGEVFFDPLERDLEQDRVVTLFF